LLFSQSVKQYIKAGKKANENGNYESATYYFSKALEQEQSASLAWLTAEAARQNHDYDIAEKWYQFIVQNSPDIYPLASFWLGIVQKNQAKYQRAQINFRKYIQKNAANKDYYTLKARHEILSCENALFMTFDAVQQKIEKSDTVVNSPYSEFQATSPNDTSFWVTSYKPLKNDDSLRFTSKLLFFQRDSLHYYKLPLDTILNSKDTYISSFALSDNSRKLVLSICQKNGHKYICKLYRSYKNNMKWEKPELLPDPINQNMSTTTHPDILETDTANYLLFASDRNGGFGKLDIWAVKVDSSFLPLTTPFNLGKNVNSIDDDCCPYYDFPTKTLYFSSEWFTNLGGFDIFSSFGTLYNLGLPQNLGYPINTNHNEIFYQISPTRKEAFFASNRVSNSLTDNEKCCNDIYRIPREIKAPDSLILAQRIKVHKKHAEELIPVILYFHNDEPNPRTWDTTTQFSYATLYDKYISMRDEYISEYGQTLKGTDKENSQATIDAFFIDEVEKNYLKLNSFLQLLKQLLSEGKEIAITIKGYASPLNSSDYNLNLSKRRVQSLVNLLYEFEGGVFVPYIDGKATNGAKLVIKREAYGENMVAQGVSDNLHDVRNSVYSPAAAKERKIAVIAIKIEE
jgi:hypothetical protein